MSAHCGTKIKHASRELAMTHIKALILKHRAEGHDDHSAGLTPYQCATCGAWHVGHESMAPLVWHYAVVRDLERIVDSYELRPPAPRRAGDVMVMGAQRRHLSPAERRRFVRRVEEPAPLLWFSRNVDWEYSVMKAAPRTDGAWCHGQSHNELAGGGLLRFGVPASLAKLRWSDYLQLNHVPTSHRDLMAQFGNPTEWLATDVPVSLTWARAIEVYHEGTWVDIQSAPDTFFEAFDAYINGRQAVYEAAARTLHDKLRAWRQTDHLSELSLTEAEMILYRDARQKHRVERFAEQHQKRGA
jgi:hypothetical protein